LKIVFVYYFKKIIEKNALYEREWKIEKYKSVKNSWNIFHKITDMNTDAFI